MATSLREPKDALRDPRRRPELSRRTRLGAIALAATLALLLVAAGLAVALGGGVPFFGDDPAESANGSELPSGWVSLEPLLPLAPGLKEVAEFKRGAVAGASRTFGARDGGKGVLRVRALPQAAGGGLRAIPISGGRPARSRAPIVRRVRALPRLRPAVSRIVASRALLPRAPSVGNLDRFIDREVGGLPGRETGVVRIPPINPLPGGISIPPVVIPPIGQLPGTGETPLPGTGGTPLPGTGGTPLPGADGTVRAPAPALNLTVGDLRADSRFDVLLASSGRRVLERYVFRDGDISGLTAHINLRSRLFAADALRDRTPLAYATAAPLTPRVAHAAAGVGSQTPRVARAAVAGVGSQATRAARAAAAARHGGTNGRGGRGAESDARAGTSSAPTGSRSGPARRGARAGASGGGQSSASAGGSRRSSPARSGRGSRRAAPLRGRARPSRGSARRRSPRGGNRRSRGSRPSRGNRPSRGKGDSKSKGKPSSRGSGRGHDDDEGDDD